MLKAAAAHTFFVWDSVTHLTPQVQCAPACTTLRWSWLATWGMLTRRY